MIKISVSLLLLLVMATMAFAVPVMESKHAVTNLLPCSSVCFPPQFDPWLCPECWDAYCTCVASSKCDNPEPGVSCPGGNFTQQPLYLPREPLAVHKPNTVVW